MLFLWTVRTFRESSPARIRGDVVELVCRTVHAEDDVAGPDRLARVETVELGDAGTLLHALDLRRCRSGHHQRSRYSKKARLKLLDSSKTLRLPRKPLKTVQYTKSTLNHPPVHDAISSHDLLGPG